MKFTPIILVLIGAAWIGYLTISNLHYFYYGWFPEVMISDAPDPWSQDAVKKEFMRYSEEGCKRLSYQLWPLILILLGGITSLIHLMREKKRT